jgi:hypothetical protein
MVLNDTSNNISNILWQSVLLVEETWLYDSLHELLGNPTTELIEPPGLNSRNIW